MGNMVSQGPCASRTVMRFLAVLLSGTVLFGLCACARSDLAAPEPTAAQQQTEEILSVEREPGPPALQTANEATALALRYYIYARLKTEEFVAVDVQSIPGDELDDLIGELVSIWEAADALASGAVNITGQAISLLETSSADQTRSFIQPQGQYVMLAAERPGFSAIPLGDNAGEVVDRQTWAENLSKQYDALRGAQRYKQLAQQLGTDTKTAVEQMALAQKIIRNAADLEEAQAEVNEYTRSISVVEGYMTASKVGLFVGATIATGGGSLTALAGSSMSVGTAGAVIVGGVDCIVDVGQTTSSIILGEDHQVTVDLQKAGDVIQPVSMVMGLVTMDPSSAVEQVAFLGEAMMEWCYPGKVTGIAVEITKEGNSLVSARLIDLMGENIPDVEDVLEGLGLAFPKEQGVALSELILANTVDSEAAIAKMQELDGQIAALAQEEGNPGPPPQETNPSDQEDGTLTGEQPQDPKAKGRVLYEIRNVSGTSWVLDTSSDPEYYDDVDAIDVSDYTVAPDGIVKGEFFAEDGLQSGALVELSPTTYSVTVKCVAGEVPSDDDEQYVYLNPAYGQTAQIYAVTITGVYEEYAVIEWDGTSFKQVK